MHLTIWRGLCYRWAATGKRLTVSEAILAAARAWCDEQERACRRRGIDPKRVVQVVGAATMPRPAVMADDGVAPAAPAASVGPDGD